MSQHQLEEHLVDKPKKNTLPPKATPKEISEMRAKGWLTYSEAARYFEVSEDNFSALKNYDKRKGIEGRFTMIGSTAFVRIDYRTFTDKDRDDIHTKYETCKKIYYDRKENVTNAAIYIANELGIQTASVQMYFSSSSINKRWRKRKAYEIAVNKLYTELTNGSKL